jgi:preprotein translocase subunit SecG
VLLQAGQGGGLASLGGGGSDAYVGGRQAVTILTKATWWTGGVFLALSLLLSVMSSNRGLGATDVQQMLQQQEQQAAPAAPGALPLGDAAEPAAPAPEQGTTPAPAPQP